MQLKYWDSRVTTEVTNEIVRQLAQWHVSQIAHDTIREQLHDLVASDRYADLCRFEVDYRSDRILHASDAAHIRQALAFYQKRQDLDIGEDRQANAWSTFQNDEALCAETNHIFRLRARGAFFFPRDVEGILADASRKIARCLGEVPSLARLNARFGPGATTEVKKAEASALLKLRSGFSCSEELLEGLHESLEQLPKWVLHNASAWSEEELAFDSEDGLYLLSRASLPVKVTYGKLNFVPKSAKTHRSIVVEPSLNSFFQLGIGDWMARRLRKIGIDIRDQTLNQRLAREGSLTGALATLDLSSASDTIARELVFDLLPLDWALLLDRYRTGTITYQGKQMCLEKFSSMGNGFTFPLETLIFWALASACTDRYAPGETVSVYGDDIIVSSKAYNQLTRVLNACGFRPNLQKSFSSGPFRESCGKDYYSGTDIRPYYQRDAITGESLFGLYNFYARSKQTDPAAFVLSLIPEPLRLWGPDGYGDGHLITDDSSCLTPHKREDGWGGFTFETHVHKGRRKFYAAVPDDVLLPLYFVYSNPPRVGVPDVPESVFTRMWGAQYWYGSHMGRRCTHWRTRTFMNSYDSSEQPLIYDKRGRVGVVIPGTRGCKRIKVYTLGF